MSEPIAYQHMIMVPVGGGAVHFVPNPWSSETEGNLSWRLRYNQECTLPAATIVDSVEYLFSGAITEAEAIRRLKIIRAAVKSHGGKPKDSEVAE